MSEDSNKSWTLSLEELRAKALALGWDDVGITSASIPEEDILAYHAWLARGHQAELGYMENQIRCDPQALFPGAVSAVIFVTYYKQAPQPLPIESGMVATYAHGKDYHKIHHKRLKAFIKWLEERCGQQGIAKGFSDSTPILEKALAVKAGLGWFGKNTLLIHRRFGTFTLLSGILTSLSLPHTQSKLKMRLPRCGSCSRCLDACPTQAFSSPYQLDANRCLSYHLIESKKPIPESIKQLNPGYVFGCDICQNVCPHNVRLQPSTAIEFTSDQGIGPHLSLEALEEIQNKPERLFGTPLQRKGAEGLLANFLSLKKERKGHAG